MAVNQDSQYQKALKWVHSTSRFGSKLGLERISRLLSELGNPQNKCKFLHVTGTNGKGSVTAMIESVLRVSGYRTGMFTSPYLEDFRERIMVNRRMIPKHSVTQLAGKIRKIVSRMVRQGLEHPTEFEIVTAMGLMYFAQQECDYVAFEVGLGGRFDATNVVIPEVSVITTISRDHIDRLGNSVEAIAFEKAGIIKPGVPVVTGLVEKRPLDVIKQQALLKKSPLITVGRDPCNDVTWTETFYSIEKQIINLTGPGFKYSGLKIPLPGRHQQQNAACAVSAIALAAGLHTEEACIRTGIGTTLWPGRLEVLCKRPLIILDGAHNTQGAQAMAESLKDIVPGKLICIFGVLGDKSYKEMIRHIAPRCQEFILTKPANPRALDPGILTAELKQYNVRVDIEADIGKAILQAFNRVTEKDGIICCGSLYLVGPARTFFRTRLGISTPGIE